MKRKFYLISLAFLLLMAVTLACNLFTGKTDEPVVVEEPTKEPTKVPPTELPEDSSPAVPTDGSQPEGNVELGDEFRSAAGGYAFQSIPEYTIQEFLGIVMMEGPDATEAQGPFIMIMGGLNEEEKTSDQLYDDFMAETELKDDETVVILDQKTITVDGHPGSLVDLAGQEESQDVLGRVVVVAVSPTQKFTMLAVAPADRWNEVKPLVDSVLASVYFFEPEEGNIPSVIDEDVVDDQAGDQVDENAGEDMSKTPEPEPGDIFFMISRDDGFPVMVENYTIEDQYQSSPKETIIGLVSPDEEYTVILALPENLNDNMMLALIPYDPFTAVKAPSAAVYIGDVLYTAQNDGLIIFDEITDETISGTFFFDAVNSEDPNDVVSVMGTFVKLPLPK
jgi:hypothetical protein